MISLALLALLVPLDDEGASPLPKRRNDGVNFEFRATLWVGTQGSSRIRSMEEEAIFKGGEGSGTLFSYSDLDAGGLTFNPEFQGAVRFGPHAIRLDLLLARAGSDHSFQSNAITFNGDLLAGGKSYQSSFSLLWLEARYAYEIVSSDSVELWLGGSIMEAKWDGTIRADDGTPGGEEHITPFFLPVPSLEFKWRLAGALTLDADLEVLYGITPRQGISFRENMNGALRFTVRLDWSIGPVVAGAGIGYWRVDSVSLEHRDEADMLNWSLLGFELAVAVRF